VSKTRSDKFRKVARLQGRSQQAQTDAERFGHALCRAVGLDPEDPVVSTPGLEDVKVFSRGPLKTLQRILEKADGRLNGAVHRVPDVARYRIYFNDPSQIWALRGLLIRTRKGKAQGFEAHWEDRGVKITGVDDFYLKPLSHGYIGLHVTCEIKMKKGGPPARVEYQFMHDHMRLTDKLTHATYDAKRQIHEKASKEKRELTEDEELAIYNYNMTNAALYEGDARNYGLTQLRGDAPEDRAPRPRR
jgi:hypothetical protein